MSGQSESKSDFTKLIGLDAVRGFAISLVLLSHLVIYHEQTEILKSHGLAFGRAGVSIFFVLSGFLITRLLLREQMRFGNIDYKRFYLRRFARLLPAMWLYLLTLLSLWLVGFLQGLPWHSFAASLLYVRNFFSRGHETAHLWSLSIEEQFYLLWPLVLSTFRSRQNLLSLMIFSAIVVIAWRFIAFHAGLADVGRLYTGTDFRFDSLMYGAILAVVQEKWRNSFLSVRPAFFSIALIAIIFLFIHLDSLGMFSLPIGDFPIVLTSMLLIQTACFAKRNYFLVLPAILGRYSYGLYLWQQLFMGPYDTFPILRSFPLQLILTFGCAFLSYHCLESPILRWKDLNLKRQSIELSNPLSFHAR